jgi:hypothetical protein
MTHTGWPGDFRAKPSNSTVIASEAKQSSLLQKEAGLLRRFAPRNDDFAF